jgi:hypothetical protein
LEPSDDDADVGVGGNHLKPDTDVGVEMLPRISLAILEGKTENASQGRRQTR